MSFGKIYGIKVWEPPTNCSWDNEASCLRCHVLSMQPCFFPHTPFLFLALIHFDKWLILYKANPRTLAVRIIANAAGLDVELEEITFPASEDYRKIHPLGKIPAFVRSNGFVLTECIAIAVYCKIPHMLGVLEYRYYLLKPLILISDLTWPNLSLVASQDESSTLLGKTKEE